MAHFPELRYDARTLRDFAAALFGAAGCSGGMAGTLADVLLEADLMGHTTHGLMLAADYLEEIDQGRMTVDGEPAVISDRGAAICWDGRRLPGVWLTAQGVELCIARAKQHGTASLAIRRSHHIACLAAYLERATAHGLLIRIACSDPSAASVAPFGGAEAVFTPDPIAAGIPTAGDPILIDMSSSITTNAMTARLRRGGRRFPGLWAMTADGEPTDDPKALAEGGTLLPAGGSDHGHKGYGQALIVEALTQGLSGYGRADHPSDWGACVLIEVDDPEAYGGATNFIRQTEWIAAACRLNRPVRPQEPVRLPGSKALALKREALALGIPLHPEIVPGLQPWAERFQVSVPRPIG